MFTLLTSLHDSAVPSGSPRGFTATVASSTSIRLSWQLPFIHERNGIITGYTITQISGGNSSSFTTTQLTHLVTNLRPFTSYDFDIYASTSVGDGPAASSQTVTTPEAGMSIESAKHAKSLSNRHADKTFHELLAC